jgi:hypothetical protein
MSSWASMALIRISLFPNSVCTRSLVSSIASRPSHESVSLTDRHPSPVVQRYHHVDSTSFFRLFVSGRVGNFRQKNYSVEDGIDGTIGLFRRNSNCSMEQKILRIPFRTVPQRRKMFGILYHGTKLDANARNSDLTHSMEEKTTRNSVLWNKNISKHLEFCSEPFRRRDNNSEFHSVLQRKYAVNSVCWSRIICKTNFFHAISFCSETLP